MSDQTAILIFTRTAAEESAQKHFTTGHKPKTNSLIASSLIKHTVQTVKRSGIPYFTIYSDHQNGNTFGERLGNALQEVFDAGFEHIIAIGNDCPTLRSEHLIRVRDQLNASDFVLGPAADGGVYLIGVSRKSFQLKEFAELEWQSKQLLSSMIVWLEKKGIPFFTLQSQSDIDTNDDLFHFVLNKSAHLSVAAYIKNLILQLSLIFLDCKSVLHLSSYFKKNSFRSPPVSI